MATQDDLKNLALYKSLMEEVKVRMESINTITHDQRGIPSPLIYEYCFLQLRLTCELIALGCLVAHGDIVATSPKSLQKAYVPAEILNKLEDMHPDFYPAPVIPQRTEDGWHLAEYDDRPFLSKSDLLKLWGASGDILHRGNLKKLVRQNTPFQNSFDEVNKWGQKILNLLSNHRVLRVGRRITFVTFLKVDALGGAVQTMIAEAPDDPLGLAQ